MENPKRLPQHLFTLKDEKNPDSYAARVATEQATMYKARDSDQSQTEEIENQAFAVQSIETGVYRL